MPAGMDTNRERKYVLLYLVMIYVGFYFCRTQFSVTIPTISEVTQLTKPALGTVISVGYFVYAWGKLLTGMLVDKFGAKWLLLGCLAGSVLCSLAFASLDDDNASIQSFLSLWAMNRLFQSGGWPATTTIVSRWWPKTEHGRVFGIVSLSFTLGDALIRAILGILLSFSGMSWQKLFFIAAVFSTLLLIPGLLCLQPAPAVAIEENDDLIPMTTSERDRPQLSEKQTKVPLKVSFLRLVTSPRYMVLVGIAPCTIFIREFFASWSVAYFHDNFKLHESRASLLSLAGPLVSSASTVAGGIILDRLPFSRERGAFFGFSLIAGCVVMVVLDMNTPSSPSSSGIRLAGCTVLVALAALFFTSPNTIMEGAFPIELSAGASPGFAVGIVHFSGYLGAAFSGSLVGNVVHNSGWPELFHIMSVLSGLLAALGFIFYRLSCRGRDGYTQSI